MSNRESALAIIEAGLSTVLEGVRLLSKEPSTEPGPTPAPQPPAPVPPAPQPPAPVPPAPQPPAPVPVSEGQFAVHTNGFTFAQVAPWFDDVIDLSKAPPPVPWSTFRDDKQTIARPMAGAEPTEWRRLPIYGLPNEYGILTPAIVDGEYRMLYPSSVADDNPNDLIVPELHKWPARGGPRGLAITTPYWIVRGHTRVVDGMVDTNPRIPFWVGLDMVGRVYYLMRDGSVQIVATLPLKTYANDFSYFEHERKVMWVTDTAAGEILHVRRSGADFTTTVWAKVPGRATSVRAIGTKLYVANESSIIEIDALDQAVPQRVVCNLLDAFWVDYFSNGDLVVMTRRSAVHRVNPKTGAIGPDLNAGYFSTNGERQGWVMVDVDRHGTCGPVDCIYAVASHSTSLNGTFRIRPDGVVDRIPGIEGGGRSLAGVSTKCVEGLHYGWVVAIHPDEGLQLMQGGAQILPIVYAAIDKRDPWPVEDVYDVGLGGAGFESWNRVHSDRAIRPMLAIGGTGANSILGFTPDHVAQMPVAQALDFLRGGLLSTERREFSDAEARAVLYWLLRGSQVFLREGKAAVDRLFAHFSTT